MRSCFWGESSAPGGWLRRLEGNVREKLLAAGLLIGAALASAVATPSGLEASAAVLAQPKPVAPTPTAKPAAPAPTAKPAGTTPAPRAGGFPLELAMPMLAGGAAALGGGTYLLRRGKKAERPEAE
jgi:hypothetical protein